MTPPTSRQLSPDPVAITGFGLETHMMTGPLTRLQWLRLAPALQLHALRLMCSRNRLYAVLGRHLDEQERIMLIQVLQVQLPLAGVEEALRLLLGRRNRSDQQRLGMLELLESWQNSLKSASIGTLEITLTAVLLRLRGRWRTEEGERLAQGLAWPLSQLRMAGVLRPDGASVAAELAWTAVGHVRRGWKHTAEHLPACQALLAAGGIGDSDLELLRALDVLGAVPAVAAGFPRLSLLARPFDEAIAEARVTHDTLPWMQWLRVNGPLTPAGRDQLLHLAWVQDWAILRDLETTIGLARHQTGRHNFRPRSGTELTRAVLHWPSPGLILELLDLPDARFSAVCVRPELKENLLMLQRMSLRLEVRCGLIG